jgi:uncharacterized protein YdaU (DUF1376 family)
MKLAYTRFFWSDWTADTAHLDLMLRGAYMALLAYVYQHERPIPGDLDKVFRICHANSATEQQAIRSVLAEYFKASEDPEHGLVYRHFRAEREIEWSHRQHKDKSDHARLAAEARWERKRERDAEERRNNDLHARALPEHMPEHCPSNANQNQNQKEEESATHSCPASQPDGHGSESKTVPNCPHDQIIDAFHAELPELPKVLKSRWSGSKSDRALRSRWKEDARHRSMEFWTRFFRCVKTNPHWMGRNDREWKADLHWLLKRANFDKVLQRMVENQQRRGVA